MATNKPTYHIDLPNYAHIAIDLLENAGFETWCVGGYVRDSLRGCVGHDLDLATSARWETVQKIFESQGHKTFETGTKHGTLTVQIDSQIIEITTFRQEGAYRDKRHPDSVTFVTNVTEDLARRDFTINAIAYNPQRGLYDPYGGLKDLEAQCIRSVGDPKERFSEDALRILRACRFSSQLGFSLEDYTMEAMQAQKGLLDYIAAERIAHELDGFLCGEHIHDALMNSTDIIGQVIPEVLPMKDFDQKNPYHIYDVLEHTAYCLQNCPQESLVRWAAFFHDIGKPDSFFTDERGCGHFYDHAILSAAIASKAMKRLKISPRFIHKTLLLIQHHDDVIPAQPKAVKRALRRLDECPSLFKALCALKKGDALAQAPHCYERVHLVEELEQILDQILVEKEAFSLKDIALNGHDIIELGIRPGPQVKELLEKALDAVIEGVVANDHEQLVAYTKDSLTR